MPVSFLIKLRPEFCIFIKRKTLAQVFFCEFCEFFKNCYFIEQLSGGCLSALEYQQRFGVMLVHHSHFSAGNCCLCLIEEPTLQRFSGKQLLKLLVRGIFRIQSNIKDWVFCRNSERLKAVNYFYKKLHFKRLTAFWIGLCSLSWNPLPGKCPYSEFFFFLSFFLVTLFIVDYLCTSY